MLGPAMPEKPSAISYIAGPNGEAAFLGSVMVKYPPDWETFPLLLQMPFVQIGLQFGERLDDVKSSKKSWEPAVGREWAGSIRTTPLMIRRIGIMLLILPFPFP